MKKLSLKRLSIVILLMALFSFTGKSQEIIHGFKLIEKRFVKEVNADCYYFEHVKTGAKLLKIAAKDDNKTFSITFTTLPETDNGIAHILEHSVLNGSKNFPVKSPFDVLSKGSMNTFLNAMTSRDATSYPFASMNEKDYFNLMYVYMDAVFNPLLYTEPRILKQEGWHYELTSADAPLTYKGVVYNEMKGAFSNPQREHMSFILKSLYPDNVYGWESGGQPTAITTLTQKQFEDFHKKYYHPSNAYIFLYGDADMNKELEFIDSKYLSNYNKSTEKIAVKEQKAFPEMKKLHAYYPVMEGTPVKDKTSFSLNFVAGMAMDYTENMSLNILAEVLVNQESAPVRLALQKAGIGQDVSAMNLDYRKSGFTILVENANPEDKDKCLETIMTALKEVAKNGVNKEDLQGVLNRYEFRYREGSNAQKGITYLNRVESGWVFGNDPFMGLEYEKHLSAVRNGLKTRYFEGLIEKYMLNNTHAAYITFEPKPGLDKERNEQTEKELQAYKDKLTPEQIKQLVKETEELIVYQNTEDSPEAIATIPMLSLSDINPTSAYFTCKESSVGKNKVLYYDEFTNGIIYSNLMFDLRVLPQELIPYASLLSSIATSMNTDKYSYGDLNQALNMHTGSFSTYVTSYIENNDQNLLRPYFVVRSKMMNDKTDKMFELTREVILGLKLNDKERLKEILSRQQAQLENQLGRDGYGVAYGRINSYLTPQGMYDELCEGLEYFWFLDDLTTHFDEKSTEIIDNLQKVVTTLFVKDNMMATVTCGNKDFATFTQGLTNFSTKLPATAPVLKSWNLKPENKKEGIITTSKVQYVFSGYDINKLGYKWDGKMRVMNQILSTDFLYTQIRVVGGAYGGNSRISSDGLMFFSSYRDPNLKNTLDVYDKAGDYLDKFEADEATMTRYIIGTISELDAPLTPQQKGNISFAFYFNKRSKEDVQRERTAILQTKAADVKTYAKMIRDVAAQKVICVYGNTENIQAEKGLFKQIIKIK
ncbi:MAG: peptidase [Bacteroidetes bacterium HGW-Bacteroidetes-21]|jgi:hypothetical protein|nr:MAG: peptidase [Bacteroidetes bacterium HGW-Bacteroidetes-21]